MVLVAVFLMVGGGGFGGFFLPNLEFWVVDGGLCNCACIWWVLRTRNFFFFFFTEKQTLKNDFHGIFKYAFKHYKMKCFTENVLQVKYYTFENKSLLNKQSVNRLPNSN